MENCSKNVSFCLLKYNSRASRRFSREAGKSISRELTGKWEREIRLGIARKI
jgi:hypothetical protein